MDHIIQDESEKNYVNSFAAKPECMKIVFTMIPIVKRIEEMLRSGFFSPDCMVLAFNHIALVKENSFDPEKDATRT